MRQEVHFIAPVHLPSADAEGVSCFSRTFTLPKVKGQFPLKLKVKAVNNDFVDLGVSVKGDKGAGLCIHGPNGEKYAGIIYSDENPRAASCEHVSLEEFQMPIHGDPDNHEHVQDARTEFKKAQESYKDSAQMTPEDHKAGKGYIVQCDTHKDFSDYLLRQRENGNIKDIAPKIITIPTQRDMEQHVSEYKGVVCKAVDEYFGSDPHSRDMFKKYTGCAPDTHPDITLKFSSLCGDSLTHADDVYKKEQYALVLMFTAVYDHQ